MITSKKDILYTATNDRSQHFEIRDGGRAGFYLFIYENGKCIWDDLQDTLECVKEIAQEDYGVPESAWQKVE